MKNKNIFLGGLAILLIVLIFKNNSTQQIYSFKECVMAGFPVMESFPRQCRANDKNFVEDLSEMSVVLGSNDQSAGNIQNIPPIDSGVEGTVTIGPTCPVVRDGDTTCSDRPYSTDIQIIAEGQIKSSPYAMTKSDNEGNYKIVLPPGKYSFQPVGPGIMPRCEFKDVTVSANAIARLDLTCDSGVR